jgi:hypothetical protein
MDSAGVRHSEGKESGVELGQRVPRGDQHSVAAVAGQQRLDLGHAGCVVRNHQYWRVPVGQQRAKLAGPRLNSILDFGLGDA